jgi:hypothetical protein
MPQKKIELEYKLKLTPYTDDHKGIRGHLLELFTVKEFRTFRYDILVDVHVEDKTIRLIVQGISTPQFSIPEHGPAVFRTVLQDLRGTYQLHVSKPSRPETRFTVHFTPKRTVQKGGPRKSFVELETTHRE